MADTTFVIRLDWHYLGADDDPRWHSDRALYAYLPPRRRRPYYIGKCYGTTVRQQWRYDRKSDVWDCIQEHTEHHVPIVADIELPKGMRLSKKLVADIESLLIYRVQPDCNTQCKSSRGKYRRPGMKVECYGAWPLSQRTFRDED